DLIIVDEPTEGLAPQVVMLLGQVLRQLRARGIAVLLIEQKLTIALDVSDRCYVMGHGSVVFEGTPEALRQASAIRREWLEV
ncbi:MAG: ABC transporter ATP-binding protein, partial [Rhodoferax sp.]|nr:ABC transporter ATP-binding protein [Rhodoferax sp.]MDP3866468.1 ABC transporter ATP-binding protein [Rhodoferax sp.]